MAGAAAPAAAAADLIRLCPPPRRPHPRADCARAAGFLLAPKEVRVRPLIVLFLLLLLLLHLIARLRAVDFLQIEDENELCLQFNKHAI